MTFKIHNLILCFLGKNYFVFIMFIILFSVISSLRLLLEDFLATTWLFLHWIKHFEWCINCESGTSKYLTALWSHQTRVEYEKAQWNKRRNLNWVGLDHLIWGIIWKKRELQRRLVFRSKLRRKRAQERALNSVHLELPCWVLFGWRTYITLVLKKV